MKNLKISTKLLVSFAVLVAMSLIIAIVSIVAMSSLNKADDNLYTSNLGGIVKINEVNDNLASQRVYMRNIVIYDAEESQFKTAFTKLD